ncbi:MAG: putative DNA binding domain-containing protein [Bacteroidales bacterium]|nr:putative DNA binding domain-containing protein [Bacteroidales bacterium]
MPLPINISELLKGRIIEHDRIEFKEGWNPDSIYRSVCAFANDIENIGGGYIIVGVEDENGMAKRPVKGLPIEQLDAIQKQMIGFNNLIKPVYTPKLSIEEVDNKQIIVLWVPGGANRPYEVPEQITAKEKKFFYYIRKYSNSVKANQQEQQELISLANQIPFDDRANIQASLNDISTTLIRDHLRITKSRLHEFSESLSKADLLGQMDLVSGPPEMLFPRNVALMLFSESPEKFFPYTRIEIVEFPNGADDPEFNERPPFTGPVQQQITKVLDFFKTNILQEKIIKQPDKAEAVRIWNYPLEALEEAIANAIYHRDYQVREPVEVRIYPDSICILNYGGPDRSIKSDAFKIGPVKPRRYRNRRLGDFLKELDLTEGKATGIPRIKKALKENGSPEPLFDFDEDRTFFEVDFYIHPAFKEDIAVLKVKTKRQDNKIAPDFKLNESSEKVVNLIRNNSYITASELAISIGITSRAIEKIIGSLKESGLLERKGSRKGGYWVINSSE